MHSQHPQRCDEKRTKYTELAKFNLINEYVNNVIAIPKKRLIFLNDLLLNNLKYDF